MPTAAASSASITPKTLTVGFDPNHPVKRTYNGNTTADLTSDQFTFDGVVGGDSVKLSYTAAKYDNRNVGTGKTVTATGLSLTGASAGELRTDRLRHPQRRGGNHRSDESYHHGS